MSILMKILNKNKEALGITFYKAYEEITIQAYDEPHWSGNKMIQKSITGFSNMVFKICYKEIVAEK